EEDEVVGGQAGEVLAHHAQAKAASRAAWRLESMDLGTIVSPGAPRAFCADALTANAARAAISAGASTRSAPGPGSARAAGRLGGPRPAGREPQDERTEPRQPDDASAHRFPHAVSKRFEAMFGMLRVASQDRRSRWPGHGKGAGLRPRLPSTAFREPPSRRCGTSAAAPSQGSS